VTRRLAGALALATAAAAVLPAGAAAHGLQQRADLPIPEWLFGWAAAAVLIVSFVAFAVLWPAPKLEGAVWRPLPAETGRILASRSVGIACGGIGVFLLGIVLWAGFAGKQNVAQNITPIFVYVVFWLGLVPVSVLFGDVFRAFNPWRALGGAAGWIATRVAGGRVAALYPYPERLGRWPAAAGLLAFAWLELIASNGTQPRTLAAAALVYTLVTLFGMALFGADAWINRAEAFSVYFNLLSRLSPLARQENVVGTRRPLSGLASLEPLPGTVAVIGVMIGTVTFDGASEGSLWQRIEPHLGPDALAGTVGLAAAIVLVWGFYRLGILGAERVGARTPGLVAAFAHSLVPIALAYVAAHYFTLLLYQGQAIARLVSDPAGRGWNLFGTDHIGIDFGLLGAETTWYVQVAFVVVGHVLGLALAHDRALVLYERSHVAVRSQYWMLAVMVGFTSLALWLLSQANA
jgi:hypothetical protein